MSDYLTEEVGIGRSNHVLVGEFTALLRGTVDENCTAIRKNECSATCPVVDGEFHSRVYPSGNDFKPRYP